MAAAIIFVLGLGSATVPIRSTRAASTTAPSPKLASSALASPPRALVGRRLAIAGALCFHAPTLASPNAVVLVEGQVSLGDADSRIKDNDMLTVELVARRIGKGIIATKQVTVDKGSFPLPFQITSDDLAAGVNLERSLEDDIFILGTLTGGGDQRIAQSQGKAQLKKGVRLKPLLVLD